MGNTLGTDNQMPRRSLTMSLDNEEELADPDNVIPVQIWEHTVCGPRPDNEDAHVISPLPKHPDWLFVAVYDGHGGSEAARFAAEHLHIFVDNELEVLEGKSGLALTHEDLRYAIIKACIQTDDEFLNTMQESGCTVCFVLLNIRTHMMVAANLGDARAIMSRSNGRTETLTFDHTPSGRDEIKRIEEAGHKVVENADDGKMRLDDLLACSRAIGDIRIKGFDKKLLASKKSLCPYPYFRDFLLVSGVPTPTKATLRSQFEQSKGVAKDVRKRFKREQKDLFNVYKQQDAKKELEKQERIKAREMEKADCAAKGIPYVAPKRKRGKLQFNTRWKYPTSDFKFRDTMVVDDDEDDMDQDMTTKPFQFIVVACDGLYDVMSNAEVTSFVNEQLHERARVTQAIIQTAYLDAGLNEAGDTVVSKKITLPPRYLLPGERPHRPKDREVKKTPTFRPLDTIAADLCALALKKGTTDNVSVIIIMLEPPPMPVLKHKAMYAASRRRKILKGLPRRSGSQEFLAEIRTLAKKKSGSRSDVNNS